jgi:hypothetical protein
LRLGGAYSVCSARRSARTCPSGFAALEQPATSGQNAFMRAEPRELLDIVKSRWFAFTFAMKLDASTQAPTRVASSSLEWVDSPIASSR